jgi:hypothetical protein
VVTGHHPKEKQMPARKTKTPAPKRAVRKAQVAPKGAPKFEAKVGDATLVAAAKSAAAGWRTAVEQRDAAIIAAVKGGTSARQVALACGLSHAAVLKIVKR